MRNLLLHIQFDGTGFSGWQEQDGPRTVQEDVRRAIETMVQHEVQLSGASRTDKGVHAEAHAANFKTESVIPIEGFRRGLNANLADGDSIEIGEVKIVLSLGNAFADEEATQMVRSPDAEEPEVTDASGVQFAADTADDAAAEADSRGAAMNRGLRSSGSDAIYA